MHSSCNFFVCHCACYRPLVDTTPTTLVCNTEKDKHARLNFRTAGTYIVVCVHAYWFLVLSLNYTHNIITFRHTCRDASLWINSAPLRVVYIRV